MQDALSMAVEFILGLVMLLLGLGVTLVGVLFLVSGWRERAWLRRRPRTLVRDAHADSFVKMEGQVVVREPVHAPLADVDCAYFQMSFPEEQKRMEERVETDYSEEEYATGWALEDESGRIEVEPKGAELKALRARTFSPGSAARAPGIRRELLAHYLRARDARMGLGTDLREERLELGTTVVAVGWVRQGPRGLVLTGGSELRVFGGTEKELTSIQGSEVVGGVLLVVGLLLCSAGVYSLG